MCELLACRQQWMSHEAPNTEEHDHQPPQKYIGVWGMEKEATSSKNTISSNTKYVPSLETSKDTPKTAYST